MKCRVKQIIKRVIAAGMALWMALLPTGGNLTRVYGSQMGANAAGNFRIAFDEFISNVEIQDGNGNTITGTDDGIKYETADTQTFILTEGGGYTLSVGLIPELSSISSNIEIVDAKGLIRADRSFTAEAEVLNNDPGIPDVSLEARLRQDTIFQISDVFGIGITSVMANNTSVTKRDSGYILAAGTPLTADVIISFQTEMSQKADKGEYRNSTEGKRNYIYRTTIGEILKAGASVTLSVQNAAVYTVTVDHGTVEIPSPYKTTTDPNQYYEPLGSDSFYIAVKPDDEYEISEIVIRGAGAGGSDVKLEGESVRDGANLAISETQKGNIIVTTKKRPMDIPNGSFQTEAYYGTEDAIVTYTRPQNMKVGYELQYIICNSGSESDISLAGAAWEDFPNAFGADDTCTLTVPYEAGTANRYIYVRYSTDSGASVSGISSPQRVAFDEDAPVIQGVKLSVGGTDYEALYVPQDGQTGAAAYYEFDGNGVYINGEPDLNSEIRVYVADNQGTNQSGPSEQLPDLGAVFVPDESGISGYYAIPYGIQNKTDILSISVSDKVKNQSGEMEIRLGNIAFDLTPPTADCEFRQGDSQVDIGNWQTGAVTVILTPRDIEPAVKPEIEVVSGVKEVHIRENGIEIGAMDGNTGIYTGTVDGDGEHILEIAVSDAAGNMYHDTKVVKIDKTGITNPEILLEGGRDKFHEDFIISAGAVSKSGIQMIHFEFLENGIVVREHTVFPVVNNFAAFTYTKDMGNFDGIVRVTFTDVLGRVSRAERAFSFNRDGALIYLSADSNWTNENASVIVTISDTITNIATIEFYVDGVLVGQAVPQTPVSYVGGISISETSASHLGTQVEVVVTSASGKKTYGYAVVRVDKQVPVIQLDGITDGAVYNTARSLQITTTENIWQEMRPVSVTAVRTLDGISNSMDLGAYEVRDAVFSTTQSFFEDGAYQVTILAMDAAGNSATRTISFTIDRTAPVLTMTGVSEGTYSNRPVQIRFQSVESFFQTNNVRISVERKLGGSTYGRTISFANTGRISNVSNTFSEDGDYTITFSAIDGAGNVAATQTLSFTVDCTAPSISLKGVTDYFVTKQSVVLDFSVIEAYFETNHVQIQGTRRTPEGKIQRVVVTGWNNTGRSSSLRQEFTEDGYYTITITAKDKAGNSKSQTIHFTIDTTPPIIGDLSAYDGKYLTSFQLKDRLEDLIIEMSVPTLRMTLNGEPYDGSEVTKDGKYTLVIQVEDEVGLTASKTIEFVIDTVAPKIIFAGAENNRIYTETVNLNLSLENERDTILSIRINGEPYELSERTSYDLVFNEQGYYEIVIDTIDEAGNTNSQTIAFTYTEQKNIILLFIIIGAVVIAAGLVIGLLVKSKRKEGRE